MEKVELREKFAEIAHKQWSGWMKYLFSIGTFDNNKTWIMPKWATIRWCRQMGTDYKYLSEKEKDSDRKEADKFLEFQIQQPSQWIKLSDHVPTVEEVGKIVLIYYIDCKAVNLIKTEEYLFSHVDKFNILWQKIELPAMEE